MRAGTLRQRVWAAEAVPSGAETIWHVRARTPAYRDVPDEPDTYGIGAGSIVEPPLHCAQGRNVHLGDQLVLNVLCAIVDRAEVCIGDRVMLEPAVQLHAAAHHLRRRAAAGRSTRAASPAAV